MWMVGLFCIAQERWDNLQSYISLRQKNEQLLIENTRLALENSAIYEMRLENKRLRALIGFKDQSEHQLIAARIIARGRQDLINGIVLDVGAKDSIRKYMPVVVADGLVGRIYQIGKDQSIGHLLLDQNFRVSSKTQRSRVEGIVSWEGGDFCWLKEVPQRSDVVQGDTVITSGRGDIFPPGILIGYVTEIKESPRGLFMDIKVKPAVDFDRLEEVLVIVNKNRIN